MASNNKNNNKYNWKKDIIIRGVTYYGCPIEAAGRLARHIQDMVNEEARETNEPKVADFDLISIDMPINQTNCNRDTMVAFVSIRNRTRNQELVSLLDKTILSRSELGATVAQNEAWHTKAANHQYAWKRNAKATPCKQEADCGYCQQNNAGRKTALKQEDSKLSKKEKENRGTRSDSIKRSYSSNSAFSSEAKRSHPEATGRGTYTRIYTQAPFPADSITCNYRIPKKQVNSPLITDQDKDQMGQPGLPGLFVKDRTSPDVEDKYKQGYTKSDAERCQAATTKINIVESASTSKYEETGSTSNIVGDNRDHQEGLEDQHNQRTNSQNISTAEATHTFATNTAHLGSVVNMSILVEHRSLTDPGTTQFQVYQMEQVGVVGVALEEFLRTHKKQ